MDWTEHHFYAMGSQMSFWLEARPAAAASYFEQAEALFHEAEQTLSRFDGSSELSRLNRQSQRWLTVSARMWSVVSAALEMARVTGGLFDPTLLPALEAAGYTRSFAEMNGQAAATTSGAPQRGRWAEVRLDPAEKAVWLPAGVRLDLGGIAKGHTASAAVRLLSQAGPCLVDAGGDLTAGAAPRDLPGWPVAIAAPGAAAERGDLFQLWLADATLATSGVDYRRWRQGDRWMHHLIDPRSGRPAETDALSATVLASGATEAEGWATAALLLGVAGGAQLLSRRHLAAALVGTDGRVAVTPALSPQLHAPVTN